MTFWCRDCRLAVGIPPTAQDGCCPSCRPTRSHSTPRRRWRAIADENFDQLLNRHNVKEND